MIDEAPDRSGTTGIVLDKTQEVMSEVQDYLSEMDSLLMGPKRNLTTEKIKELVNKAPSVKLILRPPPTSHLLFSTPTASLHTPDLPPLPSLATVPCKFCRRNSKNSPDLHILS